MPVRLSSLARRSQDTEVSLVSPSAISQSSFLLYSSRFPKVSSPTVTSSSPAQVRRKHNSLDRKSNGTSKSTPKASPRSTPRDSPRNTPKDSPRNTPRDSPRDSATSSPVPYARPRSFDYYPVKTLEFSRHKMRPEDPYLSYHDVLLTKEDIDTLRDDWLTDNVITFYQEYLEHETLTRHKDAHVVLLRPSMTLMLFLSQDPQSLKEALPSFEGVSHIFLPINDNTDMERAEGGSHWSLLVVSTADRTAFHYDSLCSANNREGRTVTNNMAKLLGYPLKYLDLEDAPQQSNSSDCGVFVCMIMTNLLVTRLLTKPKGEQVSMSMKNRPIDARAGRKHLLKLIEDFRKEGERRRTSSDSPRVKHGDSVRSGSRSTSNSRSPPRID